MSPIPSRLLRKLSLTLPESSFASGAFAANSCVMAPCSGVMAKLCCKKLHVKGMQRSNIGDYEPLNEQAVIHVGASDRF